VTGDKWVDVGASAELAAGPVQEVRVGKKRIALTHRDGHVRRDFRRLQPRRRPARPGTHRGRLRRLSLALLQVHWQTGAGEPGYEADRVPSHAVKVENGRVLVSEDGGDEARPAAA
jgi:hypothetical protein